jgi:hypothetical protein|nr:MAG TPA: hypothetical protein [Caudoviricetes sp.]
MDKDKELELKVQMFCEAIRSTIYENTYDRVRNVAESVNEAFDILKQRTDKC